MTILKTGEFKKYIFECGECGCTFTADSSEVIGYESVLAIPYPVMNCPWCKKKIVSGSEISDEALEELSKQFVEVDEEVCDRPEIKTRCKNCKFLVEGGICDLHSYQTIRPDDEDFCSCGEPTVKEVVLKGSAESIIKATR